MIGGCDRDCQLERWAVEITCFQQKGSGEKAMWRIPGMAKSEAGAWPPWPARTARRGQRGTASSVPTGNLRDPKCDMKCRTPVLLKCDMKCRTVKSSQRSFRWSTVLREAHPLL